LLPKDSSSYFDLEDQEAGRDQPMTALERLRGVVVIDEIQRLPELFPVLRVLADRRPLPARFLILGSASLELLRRDTRWISLSDSKRWNAVYFYANGERDEEMELVPPVSSGLPDS
jgi:hypothetical protein